MNLLLRKITQTDLKNKRVMIREDFNVPMENGTITHDARLIAALPTIEYAFSQGAKITLLSHLGRPEEGISSPEFSLAPAAKRLEELLKIPVIFDQNWLNNPESQKDSPAGTIRLAENVRFNRGEKNNDDKLAQKMANLCDVFVMDAFATAHRAEASTCGIVKFAPAACAGFLLIKELEALTKALENPSKPLIAIIGGSKVSTKLVILEKLMEKINGLIVGGGIANTFLAASGFSMGKSLMETDLIPQAQKLIQTAKNKNIQLYLPVDAVVSTAFSASSPTKIKNIEAILPDEMMLDIGPQTAQTYDALLQRAGTIIWNGPVGVFEFKAFEAGTKALAQAIARSPAFSLAGGGDTLSAIDKFHIADKISYISTGGGAFLEFIEGKKLPALESLEQRAKS